jgi:hypothetical protein
MNTAINPASFLLYSDDWQFIADARIDISGREFDALLPSMKWFLDQEKQSIQTIKKLYVVSGPISFTGWRIATLTAGTIALVHGIELYALTVFEYWQMLWNSYPMAIEANATEVVEQLSHESSFALVQKWGKYLTWEAPRFGLPNHEKPIQWEYNLTWVPDYLKSLPTTSQLDPIYLKKPNITLSSRTHE